MYVNAFFFQRVYRSSHHPFSDRGSICCSAHRVFMLLTALGQKALTGRGASEVLQSVLLLLGRLLTPLATQQGPYYMAAHGEFSDCSHRWPRSRGRTTWRHTVSSLTAHTAGHAAGAVLHGGTRWVLWLLTPLATQQGPYYMAAHGEFSDCSHRWPRSRGRTTWRHTVSADLIT